MSFFITETTDEKPKVLLISAAHVLAQKVERFFREKDFEVTRQELGFFINLTEPKAKQLSGTQFYKIILILEEDFFQVKNWEHLFQFLQQRPEQLILIAQLLTALDTKEPLLREWQERAALQRKVCLDIQKWLPQLTFIYGQDLLNFPSEEKNILSFVKSEIERGVLPTASFAFYPQTVEQFFDETQNYLLFPGFGQKFLFQAKKKTFAEVSTVISTAYQERFGSQLMKIELLGQETPEELHFTEVFKNKTKNFHDSFTQMFPQTRPNVTVPHKITLPDESFVPTHPVPLNIPYIENRLKKYEKKMEELAKKDQFHPYWSRASRRATVTGQILPRKISKENKYEQQIEKEIHRLFGEQRVQQKIVRTKVKAKQKIRTQRKNKNREKFFHSVSAILGVTLGIGFFWGTFALTNKLTTDQLFHIVQSQVADPEKNIKEETSSLGRLGQFLNFQTAAYQFFIGSDHLQTQRNVANLAMEVHQSEELRSGVHQLTGQAFSQFIGQQTGDINPTLDALGQRVGELYQNLSLAQEQMKELSSDYFSEDQLQLLDKYDEVLQDRRKNVIVGDQLKQVFPSLLGMDHKKVYAVMLQNNQELRPTGGFLQAVALITVEKGVIVDYQVFDIATLDKMFTGQLIPPSDMQSYLGEKNWLPRDANWQPGFPDTARQVEWFVEKSLGKKTDGVVAMNLYTLRDLLQALGPVSLPEYNEVVNDRNIFERVQFHSEIQLVQSAKTDYMSLLLNKVLAQVITVQSDKEDQLLSQLYTNLRQDQLLMYLNDPAQNVVIATLGWSGDVVTPQCPSPFSDVFCGADSAFQVESNVGANKANYSIERSMKQSIFITPTSVKHQRTITFKNTSFSAAWPLGSYKNYLRLYVPENAVLEQVQVDNQTVPMSSIITKTENGKKFFGVYVEVPIQQSKVLALTYSEPIQQKDQLSYVFFAQKQPGTGSDPLLIEIQADPSLHPKIIAPQAVVKDGTIRFSLNQDKNVLVGVKFN